MTNDELLKLSGKVSLKLMKTCMQLVKENTKLKRELAELREQQKESHHG